MMKTRNDILFLKSEGKVLSGLAGKTWRLGVLAVALLFSIGCVPLRYYGSGGGHSSAPASTRTKSEFTKPEDYKNLGSDAWKNEMEGIASWYGEDFDGKPTASGEDYDMYDMTAAHPTLPLGSYVKVTNLHNGRAVVVKVNDRGPIVPGRIIDLSYGAAHALQFDHRGLQRVRLDLVRPHTHREAYETVAYNHPIAELR